MSGGFFNYNVRAKLLFNAYVPLEVKGEIRGCPVQYRRGDVIYVGKKIGEMIVEKVVWHYSSLALADLYLAPRSVEGERDDWKDFSLGHVGGL